MTGGMARHDSNVHSLRSSRKAREGAVMRLELGLIIVSYCVLGLASWISSGRGIVPYVIPFKPHHACTLIIAMHGREAGTFAEYSLIGSSS